MLALLEAGLERAPHRSNGCVRCGSSYQPILLTALSQTLERHHNTI